MNAVVHAINAAGQAFAELALPMLIQSAVLILILLLIDLALRRRVRAVFRYWIWMLVLLKLLLPPSLCSPISFGTWFGDTLEAPTAVLDEALARPEQAVASAEQPQTLPTGSTSTINPIVQSFVPKAAPPITLVNQERASVPPPAAETPPASVATRLNIVPPTPPAPALTWQALCLLTWAAVALALLLLLLQRAWFVRGLVAQAQDAPPRLLAVLNDCRTRMRLTRPISLRVSPNAASPAVCGLLRPVILIPKSLAPKLQPRDMQAVLLHELAHVKRGDLWVNLIQTLLQIIYFYNPLFWLANLMIRRVREQAVDEAVLVAMGETARDYPETLLNVAKLAFRRRPALSLRLIGVVESKSALSGRIKHILTRPLPQSTKIGLLGLVAIVVVAAFLLPMAQAQRQDVNGSESRSALLPDCGVWLSDIDGQDLPVLDLASETIITLPQVKSDYVLTQTTSNRGVGDILYYYDRAKQLPKITFLRSAAFAGAPTSDETLTRTIIPSEIPWEATLTTGSKDRYETRITRADERGCAIHFRPFKDASASPKAILPHGITVEMVGVCEYPSAGKSWWRPDGSPLEEAPYDKRGAWVAPNDRGKSPFELALRVQGLPTGWNAGVQTPGSNASNSSDPPSKAGKRLPDLRWLMMEADPDRTTCTMRCDIAAPWQTIARSAPKLNAAEKTAEDGVRFTEIREGTPGWTSVTITGHAHEEDNVSIGDPKGLQRIVAVLKDGQIVETSLGWHTLEHGGAATAYFSQLSLAEVEEFRLQVRPLTRVDFENVSLRPGQKTEVKVRVKPYGGYPDPAEAEEEAALPLTRRTAKVMPVAEQEARRLNHSYVGTEHILLALARQENAISARVLANLGVDIDALRAEVNKLVRAGAEPVTRRTLPRTPRAKRVMQYAREEARSLNHDYLGTEHFLLGLTEESNSIAAQVLANL
ncbi:MAG: M48 family metalloprotease, partial [Phycisphaerales bacterium]